jgi:beta propeller repeat protein
MRVIALVLLAAAAGCSSCSGRTHTDGQDDGADMADARDEGGVDTDVDAPPDRVDADVIEDPVPDDASDVSDGVDTLPSDCFTPIDAPTYEIHSGWEVVEPDREPMPCEGCCRQVTFSPYDVRTYDIWGNIMVYRWVKDDTITDYREEIRIKDLNVETEHVVRHAEGQLEMFPGLALFQETFVYVHSYYNSETTERCDVYLCDVSSGCSGTILEIEFPREGDYWCPGVGSPLDMDENYVVYESNRQGIVAGQQIYLLDVTTGEERQISVSTGGVLAPRIWGKKVVYFGWYQGNPEVYLYDIETGSTENLTNSFDSIISEDFPALWENVIAYRRAPSEAEADFQGDVYMMDIFERVPVPVCAHPSTVIGRIDIFSDIVAWVDYRNDPCPNGECRETNTDIYYYRISSDTEFQGVPNSGIEGRPRIFNNRIFFVMHDATDYFNVFMIEAQ